MINFIESANSRETDIAVMAAILAVADGDEARAEQIWENGPTESERDAIRLHIAARDMDPADLCWGASGTNW